MRVGSQKGNSSKNHFVSSCVVINYFVVILGQGVASGLGGLVLVGELLSVTTSLPKTPNLPESALNPHSKSSFTNGIDDRVAQKTGHEDTSGDVSSVSSSSSERMTKG